MEKFNKSRITRLSSNRYFNYTLFVLAGFFLGWLIFRNGHNHDHETGMASEVTQETIWTCSMHPQIRMPEPGDCPICGMDLIPLVQNGSSGIDPDAVNLSREGAALANVQTSVVSLQKAVREVRLYGKVAADERMIQSQVSHVTGRIEKLFVNFTGESVRKGQVLAQVYSPELVSAQQELIEASKMKETQPAIYEASREKLRLWKITEEQIEATEKSGVVQSLVDVVSNTGGIVVSKLVNTGNYVSQGSLLYEIADLSGLWVLFDAYESDLRFLKRGEKISFTVEALPGEKFTGMIDFIDPVIDPVTRVARVRVEIRNSSGRLKPEMFVTGIVSTALHEYSNTLIIPRSAVLWTGKRSIVYVRQAGIDEPVFKMREVDLGPALGDSYVVVSGLAEGEEIVTNGTFSVDAAAQLAGKPSMMNQAGGAAINHAEFMVEGKCEMCKERIETTAMSVKGVESATWDIDNKMLHLAYDKSHTSLETVQKAIAQAGHDNSKYRAPDEVYNNLPECCLYRDIEKK